MDINCDGLVIRETLSGENNKLLTILTPKSGKVFALAKGVKKLSSKNASACQLFAFSEFELLEKDKRYIVKTASLKEMFFGMRQDISRYALACYFAEVINFAATQDNDETEMLRLMLNALYALSNKQETPLWLIKGAFELKLSSILGFMPDLSTCSYCSDTIQKGHGALFSFSEGCIICKSCAEKSKNERIPFTCSITNSTLSTMAYICNAPIEKFISFKYQNLDIAEFSFVCENYLIHKTERSYDTLRIYKSIVNSL